MTVTDNELRAEAAAIQARRPDITSQTLAHIVSVFADNADVRVDTHPGRFPVALHFGVPAQNDATVYMDPGTALRVIAELTEACVECEACERAFLRESTQVCAGSGATLCTDDCHPSACISKATCFHVDEYRDDL